MKTVKENRRRYLRIPFWADVHYTPYMPEKSSLERIAVEYPDFSTGRVRNISAGGLLFDSPHNFKTGDFILMDVAMTPDEPPVRLRGEVMRVTPGDKEDSYHVAVNFIAADESETVKIAKFVERYYT